MFRTGFSMTKGPKLFPLLCEGCPLGMGQDGAIKGDPLDRSTVILWGVFAAMGSTKTPSQSVNQD